MLLRKAEGTLRPKPVSKSNVSLQTDFRKKMRISFSFSGKEFTKNPEKCLFFTSSM